MYGFRKVAKVTLLSRNFGTNVEIYIRFLKIPEQIGWTDMRGAQYRNETVFFLPEGYIGV